MTLPYDVHDPPLMVCGHYANSVMDGKPACVVHATTEQNPDPAATPDFWYCPSCKRSSDTAVAFANLSDGTHYDGCRGWD